MNTLSATHRALEAALSHELAEMLRHCIRAIGDRNPAAITAAVEHFHQFVNMRERAGRGALADVFEAAIRRLLPEHSARGGHGFLDAAAFAGFRLIVAQMTRDAAAANRVQQRRETFTAAIEAVLPGQPQTAVRPPGSPPPQPPPRVTPPQAAQSSGGTDRRDQAESRLTLTLRERRLSDMMTQWHNALRTLTDRGKHKQHAEARRLLDAIRQEWIRRRGIPPVAGETFVWPSTEAGRGSQSIVTDHWLKHGVLKFVGYKVGNSDGQPQAIRERILREVFEGPIPPAFPPDYYAEWDEPGTAARLKKMANTIAALARNAKRQTGVEMSVAIQHWEQDLAFLRLEYYVGRFRFDWPDTAT